jgi:hypothetical protein
MPLHFTVLASGSAGNASLLQTGRFGLLLDIGLGPRLLGQRLKSTGASWHDVHAVLLTHTHGDHWRDTTLAHLRRRGIPLYCHAEHHEALALYGPSFEALRKAGLVRGYDSREDLVLGPGLRCQPLPLRHDGGATFGFRFDAPTDSTDPLDRPSSLGYAADLGCWDCQLAEALADVELLALEFNHDVHMQHASGRSPRLIRRVLGDHGHLSNAQAAELLGEILRRSLPGLLRHVVLLHLSRDCNRPELAVVAAREVLADLAHVVQLHTACQLTPGPTFVLGAAATGAIMACHNGPHTPLAELAMRTAPVQRHLPGME